MAGPHRPGVTGAQPAVEQESPRGRRRHIRPPGAPPAPAPVWPPFVQGAVGLALTGGFGLGGLLFASLVAGAPAGVWWLAAAQAHGHAQLFGWAGLMIVGVALHFLPRFRGAPPVSPRAGRWVFGLALAGLLLRLGAQPALALTEGPAGALAAIVLVVSGGLELIAATLAVGLLLRVLRAGRQPLRERPGLVAVLPFFLVSVGSLWLALALNVWAVTAAAWQTTALPPPPLQYAVVHVALYGFLLPVAVAMSARTFPLYLRTRLPRHGVLQAGLALLLIGAGLRLAGDLLPARPMTGAGNLALAASLGLFCFGVGVFAPRQHLPHERVRVFGDPVQLHLVGAYGWLTLAGGFLALNGLADLGGMAVAIPRDAERHALGAGFITLLILGVGPAMLPGFASRPLRQPRLLWATLALGALAAVLRVVPPLLPALPAPPLMALAGASGLAALVVFAWNVPLAPRRPPASNAAAHT